MTLPKLAATGLAFAAFLLPLAAFAQDANPPEANPPEAKPPETRPAETRPAEAKPAEIKPAEAKPAEVKPAEAKPAEAKAAETKPGVFKIPGTDTTLELNGFIESDVVYDFDSADEDIRGDDWASFAPFQPLDGGEKRKARLYFTARTSRVGFTTNTPTGLGALTVRVEGDFNSPSPFNYSPRRRRTALISGSATRTARSPASSSGRPGRTSSISARSVTPLTSTRTERTRLCGSR